MLQRATSSELDELKHCSQVCGCVGGGDGDNASNLPFFLLAKPLTTMDEVLEPETRRITHVQLLHNSLSNVELLPLKCFTIFCCPLPSPAPPHPSPARPP